MALMPEAGGIKRFLLNGIRDNSRGFPGHGKRNALLDGGDNTLCRSGINDAGFGKSRQGAVQDGQSRGKNLARLSGRGNFCHCN